MRELDFHGVDPSDFDEVILGYSGGKDSTALACALKAAGVRFTAVYADTGWERLDRQTNENVVLRYARETMAKLGVDLVVVGREGGMQRMIRAKEHGGEAWGMPRVVGANRWCSRELKLRPLIRWLRSRHGDDLSGVLDLVGIRAEESAFRAKMVGAEVMQYGMQLVRPILRWTVADVLAAHHEGGVLVNPLYKEGFNRVGCWPCFMTKQDELLRIADVDPQRIDEIADLEESVKKYRDVAPTFFTVDSRPPASRRTKEDNGKLRFVPIRDVVTRARSRRSLKLFDEALHGGCMAWGMCDAPGATGADPE